MTATPGRFKLTRDGSTAQPITVNLEFSGAAVNGVDYNLLPNTVTFPAGASSVFVDVIPKQDSLIEGSESVTLSVGPGSGYAVCTPSQATIQIVNVNPPGALVDSSLNNLTLIPYGGTTSASVASAFGGAAVRFNAVGNSALSVNSSLLNVASEDFWFDMRLKFFTQDPNPFFVTYNHDNTTFGGAAPSNHLRLSMVNGKLRFIFYAYTDSGSSQEQWYAAADEVTIDLTVFNHFRAARVGTQLAVWVNGVIYQLQIPFIGGDKNIGTRSIRSIGDYIHFGARKNGAGFDNGNDVYMDELQFWKGTVPGGLNNFTPPTQALPDPVPGSSSPSPTLLIHGD